MLKHVRKHIRRLLLAGLLLSGLTWFLVQPTQAASTFLIPATVYQSNGHSMAVNNGNPVLSYWSQSAQSVMVAICANPACSTTTTIIRPIDNVRTRETDINVLNDKPIVAYSESNYPSSDRLKIAFCLDSSCTQSPTIRVLDGVTSIQNVGMALNAGKPLIVYDDLSANEAQNAVKLAICSDATCSTTPIIRRFTATQAVTGGGLAVAIANGNPVVAYSTKDGGLKLLTCMTPTCSDTPLIQTIEPDGSQVWGISMNTVGSTVVMSYSAKDGVHGPYWLKMAACVDTTCVAAPNVHIIDQIFYSSQTSIAEVNGLPMIAYVKPGITLATCLDLYCNYSYATPITNSNHEYPIIRASGTHPVVSFFDLAPAPSEGNLKVYYGGDFTVEPPPTITNTPTPLPFPSATITPAVVTPSTTPTPSPTTTPTPTNTLTPSATLLPTLTPSITPVTPTSPPNSTPGPHFFAERYPTLTWSRTTWALGYQIEIDDDPNFGSPIPVPAEFSASTLSYTTDAELADGIYYWRVQAKLNEGEWSEWSATETIIVSAP